MAASDLLLLSFLTLLLFLLPPSFYSDDAKCLQGIKQSLDDPQGSLSTWDFCNTTQGSICDFSGADCWNDNENRLIKLQLGGLQLSGEIPDSLRLCSSSLESIDFSGNGFSGNIPSSVCKWFPYIVSLDFSNNQLTGEIPAGLGSCQYLNKLDLSDNQLSGKIPLQFNGLSRLTSFSVANNALKGPIPSGLDHFKSSAFQGNGGLCGMPVGKCGGLSRKSLAIIIAAGVSGAAASLLLGFGFRRLSCAAR